MSSSTTRGQLVATSSQLAMVRFPTGSESMSGPRVLDDGSLHIRARLTIPSDEIELRVTTSGGPGGQHANRSLTRVVASLRRERLRSL